MAYNVTITEVAANVAVNESSYPVTVNYNAVQLDGVNVSSAVVNGVGNLILTLSDATTIDAGYVVGPAGSDGAAGTDGSDGISITSATINGVGNLVLTLSDASTIDTGHVVGADGASGADGADGVSVSDADVVAGNLVLTLSDASTIDAGPLPTGTISYTIKDSANNTQTISDGDTITFNGTSGEIDVTVSATDTVTVGLPNDVTIAGNLTVNGTTTTINSTTLDVEDLNITVAKGAADATAANGAGLTVDGAGATLTYNSTGNVWAFDRDLTVSGGTITATKISNWDTAYSWGDHSTQGYITDYTVTSADVTQHQANITITESQISDLSHTTTLPYANITGTPTNVSAFTNDAGYITDYTVTSSDVVAHQGNLTITESQISDLSHTTTLPYANITGTPTNVSAFTNDAGYITDYTVTSSDVTQHQANITITESQISDLSHTTSLPFANITATPTTLSGYGITDGYADSDVDAHLNTGTATSSQILSWTGTDYDWIDVSASGLTNVVEDTTPQLGGDLDLNTNDITGTGDINITGTVTATEHLGLLNGAVVIDAKAIGSAIVKGQVVYVSGISGNTPEVQLARANSSTTMPSFGLAQADIAQNATGKIVVSGQLPGLDVADFAETGITFALGDVVYVSATEAGHLTNVAPAGESNFIQNIGKIERIDPTTNATILVSGAGRTNATPALNTGNIFYGVGNVSSTVNLDTTVDGLGYIKLPDLSVTTNPVGTAALTYNNTTGAFSYTPPDLSSYLTAETNDLTSAVTWATVPDAYISSTSVTQHQANLSITESQISDLAHYTDSSVDTHLNTGTANTNQVLSWTGTDYDWIDQGGASLSGSMTGNIDMNGYYFVDGSQSGTGSLTLSKSYTDPVSNVTSYITAIDDADLHIVQDKATPNLVRLVNENTGTAATTEFRMAVGNVTGNDSYNFGFMSMAGSGYAHPYLSNINPGELMFSNFNGNVVIGTGTGKYVTSNDCAFVVKSALGDSIFGGTTPTGFVDADALVVDATGKTTLGGKLVLRDYEEKINTGLATSGTLTPDPADGTVQKATLTGDITINGLSNATAGQTVTLILTQPSSGNYTLTSSMLFAGGDKTLSTASNAVDIMTIFYDGSTYYASLSRGFA